MGNDGNQTLPIYEIEEALCEALAEGVDCPRVVIEAPTGSGKSTQVPQILLDNHLLGEGEVLVLQPRRMAARMLAKRVAWERGGRLGDEVGYQVRFEKVMGSRTRIRYVTEGIVQRRLINDARLEGVSAVVLDEFHERHLDGDVVLARCLDLQNSTRPDLKVIVMSATLEGEGLQNYLGENCKRLVSKGRTFPVDVLYSPSKQRHGDRIWDHTVRSIKSFIKSVDNKGNVLIFMPGAYEIRRTIKALQDSSLGSLYQILPLYGSLSAQAQDDAVSGGSSGKAKIVVATNVAETSLTIDGVTLVVDSGLARMSSYDAKRGLQTLMVEKISRASADQRAGRAGRTMAGHCLRLWSNEDHARRMASTQPEIHRIDLAAVIPGLMAGGVEDVAVFPWYEPPQAGMLDKALQQLRSSGVIDQESGKLTETGWNLSQLPLDPRQGLVLLKAAEAGCLEFFAVVMAATQGSSLFLGRGKAAVQFEDYVMVDDSSDLLPIYRAWCGAQVVGFDPGRCDHLGVRANAAREIGRSANQFLSAVNPLVGKGQDQSGEPNAEDLARILLAGYSDQVGRRLSESTLSSVVVGNRRGLLDKQSVLAQKAFAKSLFLIGEMTEVEGKEVQVRLNLATQIDRTLLEEMFPDDLVSRVAAEYDESSRRVVAKNEIRFRDLVLESKSSGQVPEDQAAYLLAQQVGAGNLILKKWDNSVNQWIARINTFSRGIEEMQVSPIDEEAKLLIYEEICRGASSYRDIKNREVKPVLKGWLSAAQKSSLDHYAPERVRLSEQRKAKVIYHEKENPKISVVIQQLFEIKQTPVLGDGRIPLRVEILGPNQRPVQITDDLGRFWKTSYADVRTMLRGRYPKHAWPTVEELTGSQ
ncbi:MAG: ATP-dependent RNA helicase [Verrucomicrobiota bacterium]